ncbi:MAG: NAD-dependent epimerase/dehydratase family protein [Dehalococcoidales bacterium]
MIAKVGITGAGGLIGIDLTEGLAEKYQLTLFYHNTKPTTARKLPVVQADLSDEKQVKGIFEGLDAVIHLAAASSSLSSWENVLTQNIITTYNVFEEVRRAGVAKVVFASTNHTQHAYTMKTNTLDEDLTYVKKHGLIKLDDPPAPDSFYGVSKLFGEDLGRYYSRFYGIKVVSLRIGWAECEKMKIQIQSSDSAIKDHVRVMYLSKRDLIDITDRALQIDTDYLNAYAVSDNKPAVFDLTETRKNLGFNPEDNAKDWEANLNF